MPPKDGVHQVLHARCDHNLVEITRPGRRAVDEFHHHLLLSMAREIEQLWPRAIGDASTRMAVALENKTLIRRDIRATAMPT